MNVGAFVAGETDEPEFPGLLRFQDSFQRATRGKDAVRIGAANHFVKLKEVEVVGLEATEGLVNLARRGRLSAPVDFGHEEHPLAIAVAESFAHPDFAFTAVVVPTVVQKIDSIVDASPNDAYGFRLREFRLTQVKSAEANDRNLFSCAPKGSERYLLWSFFELCVFRQACQHRGARSYFQKLPSRNSGAVLRLSLGPGKCVGSFGDFIRGSFASTPHQGSPSAFVRPAMLRLRLSFCIPFVLVNLTNCGWAKRDDSSSTHRLRALIPARSKLRAAHGRHG